MKKALLTLALAALSTSAFAQGGNIVFQNFDAAGTIRLPNGSPADSTITVGLFLQGAAENAAPIVTQTIFGNTGLFEAPSPSTTIPGTTPGQPANLQVRAWSTAAGSYAAARAGGGLYSEITAGNFTSQPLGGTNPNPPPPSFFPPELQGFTGFTLVPEPSTYALGVLGLGALALMRRRKA